MKQLFEILANHGDGVAIISKGGDIMFWNKSLEKITQIEESEAKSKKIWELQALLAPSFYSEFAAGRLENIWLSKEIFGISQDKNRQRIELSLMRRDGSSVQVEQHFYSSTADGQTIFCAFLHDLTERKEAQRIIEEINQVMRHDLRTPLNAVCGFSSPGLVNEATYEDLLEYMERINVCGNRMVKIIDTSLLIDRLERGEKKIEKQRVGLHNFLEELRKEFEFFGKSFGAMLNISFDRQAIKLKGIEQMEIHVEETLFQSALINLLRNAAEASPPGKKGISLSVSWGDSSISFSIHNYGEVPEEIRNRLFQKYATAGKKQGNGLGLYTAKKIINAMQGDIKYIPGDGETTFVVELPN